MKLAINVCTFVKFARKRYSLRSSLETAKKLGFDNVELWIDEDLLDPRELSADEKRELLNTLNSYELNVSSICPAIMAVAPDLNLADPDARVRREGVKVVKASIDLLSYLEGDMLLYVAGVLRETDLMKAFLPHETSYRKAWEYAVESAKECTKHAENTGVTLGLENVVLGHFITRPEEMMRMINEVNSENFKSILDIANANVFYPPTEYVKVLGDQIVAVHVSDNDGTYPNHYGIGDGTIDFKSTIAALKQVAFDGYLITEVGYPKDPEDAVIRTRNKLEKLIK